MADLSGRHFGPYQIIEPLGEGGMAVVYKAYQPSMERHVALKVLPAALAAEPEFVGRFRQEARLLASLQHPHILPIFDFGEREGVTYIVMPHVRTGTLGDLLRGTPLDIAQATRIVTQVGEALDYAHSRGLVHRDIKPSNILIDESGNCLLTDFGIAKLYQATSGFTNTGGIIGTPSYMSPEQGQGIPVDQRTDIYSLGVLFFEMVTGRVPFEADTPIAVVLKHITDPLPPPSRLNPSVPHLVERVIIKATAKDPQYRFESAGAMVRALQSGDPRTVVLPQPAPPKPDRDTLPEVPKKAGAPLLKRKWLLLGGAVLLVLILSIGAGLLWALRPDELLAESTFIPQSPAAGPQDSTAAAVADAGPAGSLPTSATVTPESDDPATGEEDSIRIVIDGTQSRSDALHVRAGQTVRVELLEGRWSAGPSPPWPEVGAEGDSRTPSKASFPVPSAALMSLVGGVGDGEPFLVVPGSAQPAPRDGMLWLGPNDDDPSDNGGALTILLTLAEGEETPTPAHNTETATATVITTAAATSTAAATATAMRTTPTATALPLGPETIVLGQSAGGTDIEAVRFGNGPNAVVFVGGIHAGFAPASVRMARNAVQHFTETPQDVPNSATVYVVVSMNPDSQLDPGFLPGRLNANGVDLNRNWNCFWTQNPPIDNQTVFGAGGSEPFSEPETRAVSDFLLQKEPRAVVFWEARAVPGLVMPGACGPDSEVSNPLALTYAQPSGYRWQIVENFSGVVVRGDASNWLDLQGIPGIFVLMPSFTEPDWDNNLRGVLAVVREYGR